MTYYRIPAVYQSMQQTRFFAVRGQYSLEGRWQYQFGVHMATGVLAESVEVGQNATTHVELIAVGIQPQSSVQPLTNTSPANLASTIYDPKNIQLVQVFDYLTYYWNGTCVTSIYAHFPTTILFPDGWSINSESHSSGHGCGGGYASTNGDYVNLWFCASTLTEVWFTPQSEGLYNGSRYYNNSYSVSGLCGDALHWGQHWN
jgi:hypothetical protein